MRRVVLALLAVVLGGLVVLPATMGGTAQAVDCPPFRTDSALDRSDVVVHGRVTGKPTGTTKKQKYPVDVQVTFKGNPGGNIKVTLNDGRCRPAKKLSVDDDYVFFLKNIDGEYVGQGSNTAVKPYTEQLNAQLHDLTDIRREEEVTPVNFNDPASGDPRPFTRLAAPGAALTLIGILGLMLVRWAGRRSA